MIINGSKFACGTCIKGHRSSHCSHTDRPLFKIRKKGRPVSQCTYCRDLRRTKQIHVKCVCSERVSTRPPQELCHPCHLLLANKKSSKAYVGTSNESDAKLLIHQQSSSSTQKCTCQHKTTVRTIPTDYTSLNPTDQQTLSQAPNIDYTPDFMSDDINSWNTSNPHDQDQDFFNQQYSNININSSDSNTNNNINNNININSNISISSSSRSSTKSTNSVNSTNFSFVFQSPKISKHPKLRLSKVKRSQSASTQSTTRFLEQNRRVHEGYISDQSTFSPPEQTLSHAFGYSSLPLVEETRYAEDCIEVDMFPAQCPAELSAPPAYDYVSSEEFSNEMNIADTEELTALLNDVLSHRETMSSSTASVSDTLSYVSVPPSPKGHPPTYAMSCLIPTPPQAHLSQTMCGLPGSQQRCQPKKNNKNSRGESVVITITPLPYFNSRRSSSQSLPDPTSPTTTTTTTTRVVTCHCGPSCTCLGCFVHPNNLYFPTEIVDPFAGFLHHPISSASSMYSSDDESLHIMGM